jgi:hypothetical protein
VKLQDYNRGSWAWLWCRVLENSAFPGGWRGRNEAAFGDYFYGFWLHLWTSICSIILQKLRVFLQRPLWGAESPQRLGMWSTDWLGVQIQTPDLLISFWDCSLGQTGLALCFAPIDVGGDGAGTHLDWTLGRVMTCWGSLWECTEHGDWAWTWGQEIDSEFGAGELFKGKEVDDDLTYFNRKETKFTY